METRNSGFQALFHQESRGEIFAAFSSAVYEPMGMKLGGMVEEGSGNGLRPTTLLSCKLEM